MQCFYLAPVGFEVGLSSMALGLVHALEREGLSVGFVKPIAQAIGEEEPSVHFARALFGIEAPTPIPFERAQQQVRAGASDDLMEDIVSLVAQVGENFDILLVEGVVNNKQSLIADSLNLDIARSLGADTILVASSAGYRPQQINESIQLVMQQMKAAGLDASLGVMINRTPSGREQTLLLSEMSRLGLPLPLIATVPEETRLNAPRLIDLVHQLPDLHTEHAGNMATARVHEIVVAARAVENMLDRLTPGALILSACDRHSVLLATALTALRGVPLAGILLTCGKLSPIMDPLVLPAKNQGFPILSTPHDTFHTASMLSNINLLRVPADDVERMRDIAEFVSEQIDVNLFKKKVGTPAAVSRKMSPPAFRYRLMKLAQSAAKRIVLPEGDEPRTVRAAVTCHEKGIAHCVLLAKPEIVQQVAEAQGINLPADLQILDPESIRSRYVDSLVEMRKNKGMTPARAEAELEDTVMLGTMMLAQNEVDGLVSGAVHTTANTVRPALQLIKTAPDAKLVSSIFFMLMPDQVLVYGDCAINPDPNAEELADIAIQSADSAKAFGLDPKVAMISYSTGSSGAGADVDKVREATQLVKNRRPDIVIDGPLQYDAASEESVAQQKAPGSLVAGKANVFIFPDLNTGNTTYKAVQRSAHVVSVGPMLQGLNKPVNDLSRGALVDDIVYTIALTAIQSAQQNKS